MYHEGREGSSIKTQVHLGCSLYDLQEFLREKRGTTISKTVIEFDKNTHLASSKIMSGSRPNWGFRLLLFNIGF